MAVKFVRLALKVLVQNCNAFRVITKEHFTLTTTGMKVNLRTAHEGPKGEKIYSSLSLTSALDEGEWSAPRPGRFTLGKDPVPTVQEAGWAPGPVWTGAENLAPTGIRSPDRPARSESLYRLSYPGPCMNV